MTERPILFSGEMVRAILDGRKTVTRRVVNPQPVVDPDSCYTFWRDHRLVWHQANWKQMILDHCPYGQPGDRLYVRETWAMPEGFDEMSPAVARKAVAKPHFPNRWYAADGHSISATSRPVKPGRKRPSIHMPKWASRLWLQVESVRIERVQEISREDAWAEGIPQGTFGALAMLNEPRLERVLCPEGEDHFYTNRTAPESFGILWDSINGKREGCSWEDNPWVWVVEFRSIEHIKDGEGQR